MTAPQGFAAYARVFFPFVEGTTDASGIQRETHIRWKDLAQMNGWTPHALMEQETISWISDDEIDFRRPRSDLATEQFEVLLPRRKVGSFYGTVSETSMSKSSTAGFRSFTIRAETSTCSAALWLRMRISRMIRTTGGRMIVRGASPRTPISCGATLPQVLPASKR